MPTIDNFDERVVGFPAQGAVLKHGTSVRLKDGRIGWIWSAHFTTRNNVAAPAAYTVRLTQGRGNVMANAEDVAPYIPTATDTAKGAA